jgi:uncharacterized membrane protein YbhN (UPF0104 family)
MTPTEAFAWTFIFLGMTVGIVTWIIVMAALFFEAKRNNNKRKN